MSVGKICTRVVYTAVPDELVARAAERMRDHNVGALVVVDHDTRPTGIITDRDIAVKCVADGLPAYMTDVEKLMTTPVGTFTEETPVEDALSSMAAHGVRRGVVVDGEGRLAGVLALDDVLALLVEEVGTVGKLLNAQAVL